MRVEFSPRAERSLRALPRTEQERIAHRVDYIAAHGVPDDALEGEAGVHIVDAGEHLLLCHPSEDVVLIAAIESLDEPAHTTVRRAAAAPLRDSIPGRLARTLSDFWMDLRFAVRTFRQQPTFVAVTVLTLALGIGGNTAVFGVFSNVFLGELPLRDADRLMRLRAFSIAPDGDTLTFNMAPRDFTQVRDNIDGFEDVLGMLSFNFTITGEAEPERVSGIFVSPGMSAFLGVEPIVGAAFTEEHEVLGQDARVVIIGAGLWQRRFAGNPEVVGETLRLDGEPYVIVGVMPPGFRFPYDAELWTPTIFDPNDGLSRSLNVMARRQVDTDLLSVREELGALSSVMSEEFPDTNENVGIQARPARDTFVDGEDDTVLALLGAVGFLLLITCINVTNVLIARFMSRQHEISIRAALGAGSFRQLRQFLTETVLIFAAGGIGGLLVTLWLREYLVILIPEVLRDQLALGEVRLDGRLLVFTLLVTLAAALVCGGIAALRSMSASLQQVLKDGARSSGSSRRRLMQRGLVVAEVSLALVLLVGAGLMIDHFRTLNQREMGFDPENLLTLRIDLEGSAYDSEDRRTILVRGIEAAVAAVPGVESIGMTTVNPICCGDWGAGVHIEGREAAGDGSRILVSHRYVTPNAFEAMDISLNRGRLFTEQDDTRSEPVVIVDQRLADHYFPGENPLGKRLRLGNRPEQPWRSIVGVVENILDDSDYDDGWYLAYHQTPTERGTDGMHFMIRVRGDIEQVSEATKQAVWGVAPDLAVYDVRLMTEVGADLVADDRMAATVAGVFALLGTALAGFGVYGLMAFYVGQQRTEIGTRLALGARPNDVLGMVMRHAAGMAAAGLVIGIVASIALSRIMSYFMSGLGLSSAPLVLIGAALLGAATLAATWIPARRASRVDPMLALRGE